MPCCFGKKKNKGQSSSSIKSPDTATPSSPITPSIKVIETEKPSHVDQIVSDSTTSTSSTVPSWQANTKPAKRPETSANKPRKDSPTKKSPASGSSAKTPTMPSPVSTKTGRLTVNSLVDGTQDTARLHQRPKKARRSLGVESSLLPANLHYGPSRNAVSLSIPSARESRISSRASAQSSIRGDPTAADFQERVEREVLAALNFVREKPKEVAVLLTKRLSKFNGLDFTLDKGRILKTREGRAAVDDCIKFLRKQEPVPPLDTTNEAGIRMACEDHIHDNGATGSTQHDGSDGSRPHERSARYGRWRQLVGECLWYGQANNGLDMILDLIIDDGVADRGHRHCIYTASYKVVGCRVGPHSVLGMMLAIGFSNIYKTNMEKVNMRISRGPKEIDPKRISVNINPICRGCQKEIINGVLTTTQGYKYHDYCFECTRCFDLLNGLPYALINQEEVCQACLIKHKRESGMRISQTSSRRSTQRL
eukprot:GEMP01010127.1.p1 GENE.GEMP01010127.1~~GEMP01010127.1.p1  ORF type:complete len:480 (+),score=71.93 GEMP01010127.1:156-1595(+)